jgi:hypothetical protein
MTLPEVPPQVPPKAKPTVAQQFKAGVFFLVLNIIGAIIFWCFHAKTYAFFFLLAGTYWTVRLLLWSRALEKLEPENKVK